MKRFASGSLLFVLLALWQLAVSLPSASVLASPVITDHADNTGTLLTSRNYDKSWVAGPICCVGCQYDCCCAGRIKVPLTIRKTVKTTIKVKKTITKTVITGTTTKTVTANSKRLVVERSLMQREDGAAVHDQEQAAQDAVVDDLEPTTDSSSSFFSSSTSEVESEVGNSLLAKRHPFCPACPAGSNVLPYRARTGSGQLCCPPRKRVTKTTKKTIKSTVRVTQTKKIQVTSTITFVATAQTISGMLFDDRNFNGIYDVGIDVPQIGVPVVLVSVTPAARLLARVGSSVIATSTTNSTGHYVLTAVLQPNTIIGIALATQPNTPIVSITVGSSGKLPTNNQDTPIDFSKTTSTVSPAASTTKQSAPFSTTAVVAKGTTSKTVTAIGTTTKAVVMTTTMGAAASSSTANQAQTTTAAAVTTIKSTTKATTQSQTRTTTARPTAIFRGPSCTNDISFDPGRYDGQSEGAGNTHIARGPTADTAIHLENNGNLVLVFFDFSGPNIKHRNFLSRTDVNGGWTGIASDALHNLYISNAGGRKVHYVSSNGTYLGFCPTSGISGPQSLTSDSAGNLYYVTTNPEFNYTYTNEVWKMAAGTPASCPTPVQLVVPGIPLLEGFKNAMVVDWSSDYLYLASHDFNFAYLNATVSRIFANGTGSVTSVAEFQGAKIVGMDLDANGDIWVNLDGNAYPNNLVWIDKDTFAATNVTGASPQPPRIPVDREILLWGGYIYAENTFQPYGFGRAPVTAGNVVGNLTYSNGRLGVTSLAYHWDSQTIFSLYKGRVWKSDPVWEIVAMEGLNETSNGIAVNPVNGQLFVADNTAVHIVDPDTHTIVSTPVTNLLNPISALAFGPTGTLYAGVGAGGSGFIWEIPNGGTGTPNIMAGPFTVPTGNDTTEMPSSPVFSIAVDGSNNLYIATVGYYSAPGNSLPDVPCKIYKIENGTSTQTVAVTLAAPSATSPDQFGYRVGLDFYDYSSRWFSFPIAAAGNGSANGNALYVAYWGDGTGNYDVALLENGDPATNVTLDAKYQGSTALAAAVGVLYGTFESEKYQGCKD